VDVEIGPAQLADLPFLTRLLEELFELEPEFEVDPSRQEAGLRQLLEEPGASVVFVARRSGEVIGMVSLLAQVSTALGGRCYVLEDMIVTAAERNSGAGGMLLDHALRFAEKQGGLRVTLLADPCNQAALRFYARHGFTSSSMVVLRRTAPSAGAGAAAGG
jgi:predicted N-acetyltransferase YhbS